jgi:hypothetical protein
VTSYEFETVLDPEHYFQGLARQELDFHQALGELIDNSLSARRELPFGGGLEPILIEVTVEEQEDGTYCVQVADHGVGISLDDITTRIFNPGGQGSHHGSLNEHGFGLKNALALLTSGNSTNFTLITRQAGLDPDQFLAVGGPLSSTMQVRDDATREQWAKDLHHIAAAETGTKIRVIVQARYFKTIYRTGTPGFGILVRRLAEHIGVMHRYFLGENENKIRLAYRRTGEEWTHEVVQPIPVPIVGEAKTMTSAVDVGGVQHQFTYMHGMLDYNVKDLEAEQEHGWPYPLRIYYQGSNARCGVDIVVRNRVIKSGVFEEIWPDIGKTVAFNRFVGELKVGADFRTTNNKTAPDPHGENWEEILKELGTDFRPEKTIGSQTEESLRDSVVKILEGVFTGHKCITNKAVWSGGCQIDIYLEVSPDNIRLYELKVTEGRVLDLYQLLMGWDGLVKDNIHPAVGVLICKDYLTTLSEAVAAANERSDAAGNPYNIELKRIKEVVPEI